MPVEGRTSDYHMSNLKKWFNKPRTFHLQLIAKYICFVPTPIPYIFRSCSYRSRKGESSQFESDHSLSQMINMNLRVSWRIWDDSFFIFNADSSQNNIGRLLSQIRNWEETLRINFNKSEQTEWHYCFTKKELLSVMKLAFLNDLKFSIITDHTVIHIQICGRKDS